MPRSEYLSKTTILRVSKTTQVKTAPLSTVLWTIPLHN